MKTLTELPVAPRDRLVNASARSKLKGAVLRYRKARQRGASGLLEMIAVVAVILTLLVGGLVLFQQVSFSARVNDTARQLVSLQTEIRSIFQGQPDFSGLDEAFLIQAQAHPSDILVDPDGTPPFAHAFGGDLSVEVNGDDPKAFNITVSDLSDAACTRLVQATRSGSGLTGQAGFGILSVSVGEEAIAPDEDTGNIGATEAAAACVDDNANEVTFVYIR